jgi:hypothetical protein
MQFSLSATFSSVIKKLSGSNDLFNRMGKTDEIQLLS